MSEIPEDIRKLVDELPLSGDGYPDDKDRECIARAILAERERCAQIADSWEETARKLAREGTSFESMLHHNLAGDMASDIAAAIRSKP